MRKLNPERDAALWAIQLVAYPDSVRLTEKDLWWVMYESYPGGLSLTWQDYKAKHPTDYLVLYKDEGDARHAWSIGAERDIERHRANVARAIALQALEEDFGIFYACRKKENGTYRYMGFRYGLEESEYASGFMVDDIEVGRC